MNEYDFGFSIRIRTSDRYESWGCSIMVTIVNNIILYGMFESC